MNEVIMVGRLAKDPELRTTQSGKSVCYFPLAVDRKYKQEGQPTADFFKCTAWGRLAEVIDQYMTKGKQIALRGRLQNGSYTDKNGNKRYTTDIILEGFDFCGSKQKSFAEKTKDISNELGVPVKEMIDEDFFLIPDDDFDLF